MTRKAASKPSLRSTTRAVIADFSIWVLVVRMGILETYLSDEERNTMLE